MITALKNGKRWTVERCANSDGFWLLRPESSVDLYFESLDSMRYNGFTVTEAS